MDEEDNNSVNFFENLIKKLIDCINNIGENIKNFQIKLKRLPHVDMNQSKPMEEIAPKLPKDQLNELLQFEKDISSKFTFLTGLLTNKVELPDKLFNTLAFLHIKFIDLINSNQYYLEQNICGEILTLAISLYKDKSSEFINTKLKYVDPLLKLSISMIDNVKIDLKTYLLDIFIFTEKIICDSSIGNNDYKKNSMPGIVSKIIKVITNEEIKINSKIISKMIHILSFYMSIVLDNYSKDDINYTKYFEFYSCFIMALQNRYQKKIKNVLNELFEINIKLFNHSNTEISNELYEKLFLILNKTHLEINPDDNDLHIEINKEFYLSCSKTKNYSKEKCAKQLIDGINILKVSFTKKEHMKFNNILVETCGLMLIYLLSLNQKEIQSITEENKENNLNLINELILGDVKEKKEYTPYKVIVSFYELLELVINYNGKILFEVINAYELSIKEINKDCCYNKIRKLFLSNVIDSYNLEIKHNLLFHIITSIYSIHPNIFYYINSKVISILMNKTKKFNSYLQKNKLKTKKALNTAINDILHSMTVFTFLIYLPLYQISSLQSFTTTNKKLSSLVTFYISTFCDNIEQYELNMVSSTNINLINLYTIILCLHSYNTHTKFSKQDYNSHIMLSMVNYSNKISILKYASMLLVLNLSKENDLKNFIVNNFNFIINAILNKVIYFSTNFSMAKNIILNFFTSLLELINQVNNENMSNFYCGEFTKYIQKLFPYIDSNMKNKKYNIIEIILEILLKISHFQNDTIEKVHQQYRISNPQKSPLEELQNDNENFCKYLKDKISIEDANVFRQLILRIVPLVLSKNITLISKSLQILNEYIPSLVILPMKREEEENFSAEDPNNVMMPSSLGPIMHEIWQYLIFALKNESNSSIVTFKIFYEIFKKVLTYHPKFFNYERMFDDLFPAVEIVFDRLKNQYKERQYNEVVFDFIFEFMSRVIFVNKYNIRFRDRVEQFIDKYKGLISIDKTEEELTEINNNIRSILSYFE